MNSEDYICKPNPEDWKLPKGWVEVNMTKMPGKKLKIEIIKKKRKKRA